MIRFVKRGGVSPKAAGIALAGMLFGVVAQADTLTYDLAFSEVARVSFNQVVPLDGAFTYDNSANQFTSFTVDWGQPPNLVVLTLDFTAQLNNSTLPAPCGTGAQGWFEELTGQPCAAPETASTGVEFVQYATSFNSSVTGLDARLYEVVDPTDYAVVFDGQNFSGCNGNSSNPIDTCPQAVGFSQWEVTATLVSTTTTPTGTVPEPTTLGSLLVGSLLMGGTAWRRCKRRGKGTAPFIA